VIGMNSFRSAALAAVILLPLAGGAVVQPAQAQAQAPATPPAAAPTPATVAPERLAAARGLAAALNLKGMIDSMIQAMRSQMIKQIQVLAPQVKEADIAAVLDEAILPEFKAQSGDFVELAAAIWAQNFTVEEIGQLKAFYDTPIGQKSLALTPQITQQSIAVAQGWAGRVAQEAVAKHRDALRAKGINL